LIRGADECSLDQLMTVLFYCFCGFLKFVLIRGADECSLDQLMTVLFYCFCGFLMFVLIRGADECSLDQLVTVLFYACACCCFLQHIVMNRLSDSHDLCIHACTHSNRLYALACMYAPHTMTFSKHAFTQIIRMHVWIHI
jgi:hypothetical protein